MTGSKSFLNYQAKILSNKLYFDWKIQMLNKDLIVNIKNYCIILK